jgi:SET domain-containing protein
MSSEVKVAPWLCYEEIEKSVRVDADDRATDDYSTQCTCRVTTDSEGNSIRCSDESCVNWITQTECVKCDQDTCQNQRIQRGMIKKLEVLEVEGKGFGLFCNEDVIRKGEYIREYVGELVSKVELEKRSVYRDTHTHTHTHTHTLYSTSINYTYGYTLIYYFNTCICVCVWFVRLTATKNATHLFVMELKDDCFVDSRKKASISRFINHSCEPNCTIEIWTVKRRLKAAIFSLKDIPRGTELTFDYQWAPCEGRPPTRSVTSLTC